ncbi:heavy metal-associated isoprenylated plant protein 47 [Ziziphus jujuba]|uniref:Heavy metal-associated isoprenylated plant protein 47 n=1 Tax=Ziziphus jujuba TaxID=326968 RepID=A0A6P4A2V3_ZIZJJ|nr:heavy metal-associated isoprenylated plant protein 47 [Ziziphus jujuba]
MAKKIVMKVAMSCQKCKTKALQVAATAEGVNFVGLEGDQKDKVVVIGDGVDAVALAKNLRKKVGGTEIVTVADVKSS